MIRITNEKQFKDTIASDNQITIIYCGRNTCGSCNSFRPTLETYLEKHINEQHKTPVVYYEMITEDNFVRPFLGGKNLPITGVPSILAYYNGNVLGHHTGLMDEPAIETFCKENITKVANEYPQLTPPVLNLPTTL